MEKEKVEGLRSVLPEKIKRLTGADFCGIKS
jgi:hypothetical protein